VKHIATRVAVMYLGRVVEAADKDALFAAPRHPYTQALLSAIPRPEPAARRERSVIGGDVPSPLHPPSGCHFHTRCPHARPVCSQQAPALEATADGHAAACHFWRELQGRAAPVQPLVFAPARRRLERLQAAFVPRESIAPGP
jgi:oligopeptide/dipeptide ABC transporter ATP-binding protein